MSLVLVLALHMWNHWDMEFKWVLFGTCFDVWKREVAGGNREDLGSVRVDGVKIWSSVYIRG
jgi:hypothetical protein